MDVTDMKNGRTAQVGSLGSRPPTVVGLVANTQVVVGFDWYEDLGV